MQKYWMVQVGYKYTIAGREYTGDRLSNSPPMENVESHDRPSATLKRYLERFPVGREVQVHYNPDRHEQSYLEIEASGSRFFLYGAVAALFTALTMFACYFFIPGLRG
jgi:hypothetical protein